MRLRTAATLIAVGLCAASAWAHVGSPDVYAEGQAGAYRLSVVVRPPMVIPGVAEIEVRAETPGIGRIMVTPILMVGEASKHPPVPDALTRAETDPQFFTGSLWIMRPGSWQVRFAASGSQGDGELSIPLPATALTTRKMQPGLGAVLAALGLLLVLGMGGIVAAAAREAKVPPGDAIPERNRRQGYVAMAVCLVLLIAGVFLGNKWWKSEAASYSRLVYKPLEMSPKLIDNNVLKLKLHDPGWLSQRKLDDLIADHNHLMHLYMIRWPAMDVVYHLHPQPVETGRFQLALPAVSAGTYRLYADVVHANGFPETMVAEINIPAISGAALSGDDAEGTAKPIGAPGIDRAALVLHEQKFQLRDGYTMVWETPDSLRPKVPESFRFELLDDEGKPPRDMALYMGMLGHAAFVKTDGTVFAHVHPTGTIPMAAFMMANTGASVGPATDMTKMPGMDMDSGSLPNAVSFPYGFPSPGRYRIFVQMKHGQTVETGVFDADVPDGLR
jgi:hypothetical protein